MPRDADPRLAAVGDGEGVGGVRFVLAILGGFDEFAGLGGKNEAQAAIVGSGTEPGVLVGVIR